MIKTIYYYLHKLQHCLFSSKFDDSLEYHRFSEFVNYLKGRQWSSFEAQYQALAIDERHLLMCAIPNVVDQKDLYSEWRFKSTSYLALQFSGAVELEHAWKARGSSWFEDIPDNKAQLALQCFSTAHMYFEEALDKGAEDVELYVGIMQAFAGMNPSIETVKDVFNQIIHIHERHLPAAIYTLNTLSERWHGSEEVMYQFAYSLAEKDPYYNSLILCAHIEKWSLDTVNEVPMSGYFFLDEDIRQEIPWVEKGDLCIQGEDDYFSLHARNIYAFVGYKSKIRLLASKHLLKIKHLFTRSPWEEEGIPRDIVNKARKSSRLGALKKM